MLEKKALTFNPGSSSRGIFPLAFVPGDAGICVLVAIASSPLDAALLLDRGAAIPMDLLKAARGIKIEPSLVRESPRLRSGGAVDLLVVRGADGLFTPEPSVHRNVVIGGGKVLGIVSDEDAAAWAQIPGCQTLDATGQIICPGFVDCHVHITGGGGEVRFLMTHLGTPAPCLSYPMPLLSSHRCPVRMLPCLRFSVPAITFQEHLAQTAPHPLISLSPTQAGPATRTPEAKLSELINGGITTVVGISGTDGISRSLQALLAKTRALNEEGITAFMWTGAYACPPPTITGSPDVDVMTVEQIIGAGEIAVSDHRGSQPTRQELARLAAQCRVAGMLSNKCGLVHVHMGPGKDLLAPLWDVVNNTDIPITQASHICVSPLSALSCSTQRHS